ncbi:Asp/Glu racemase [Alphaproteobacteria bacterium GH1-50]|uniref:Asp/Glu racemase n=1 Tax=Kangsaoukella pontilimi TaxID=2691042 RepID=A0A7C9MHP5_9RHOB|nr:aspartate/glutamate racemase family protein [Kangsaoukella pontilimi]MXQ06295.1 Asp/Glu racemase [Kangsaoukella pontilimi]
MTLYVINPNSTQAVTDGIDRAIRLLRSWGYPIECLTLAEGPPGIESDAHVAGVVAPLTARMAGLTDATGFVIACFSDPGVSDLRKTHARPVIGIREAAVTDALTLGERFGVIAIGEPSVRRHLAAFDAMGVSSRLAGDRPLGLSVTDLADAARTLDRMIEVGRALCDEDGADVLIMGCAGMAQYRARIEEETGLPVVEPCQSAVAKALGRITLGLTHRTGMTHA